MSENWSILSNPYKSIHPCAGAWGRFPSLAYHRKICPNFASGYPRTAACVRGQSVYFRYAYRK